MEFVRPPCTMQFDDLLGAAQSSGLAAGAPQPAAPPQAMHDTPTARPQAMHDTRARILHECLLDLEPEVHADAPLMELHVPLAAETGVHEVHEVNREAEELLEDPESNFHASRHAFRDSYTSLGSTTLGRCMGFPSMGMVSGSRQCTATGVGSYGFRAFLQCMA